MIFLQRRTVLFFFTVFASNSSKNPYAAKNDHKSLRQSSQGEVLEADASPPRRKLDDLIMMPPEGYSIRCLQEPGRIHRFAEGELHLYPNGLIASSWNANWREDLLDLDCNGLSTGTPMSMNFDALQTARSKERSTTNSEMARSKEWQSANSPEKEEKDMMMIEYVQNYCNSILPPQQPQSCSCEEPLTEEPLTYDPTPILQRKDVLFVGGRNGCASDDAVSELYCWGYNESNQLLDGNKGYSTTPILFKYPYNHVDIALGFQHSCMILENSELKCWGRNNLGQLGLVDTAYDVDTPTTVNRGNSGAIQVALGDKHSCIIDTNQTLYCWGDNYNGQLGVPSKDHDTTSTLGVSLGIDVGAIQIAAGDLHTCLIDTNNNVQCWGANREGQSGLGNNNIHKQAVPAIVSLQGGVGAVHIAASYRQTCVIDTAGSVQCWGGLKQYPSPTTIPLGEGVVATQIGVGARHVCALVNDTTNPIKCWGENKQGELGDGTTVNRDTPTNVVLTGVEGVITELKTGNHQNCIVVVDDEMKKVFCWGANNLGQLGDGTRDKRKKPKLVLTMKK